MTIDYEDVLRRYIDHVGECEGTTFTEWLTEDGSGYSSVRFTREEIDALKRLEADTEPTQ